MRMNLYFGDYFNDGHGRYYTQPIEIPSQERLDDAINRVKERYPGFFDTFACDFEDASIGIDVERALLETDYPISRFIETNDESIFENFESLPQLFSSEWWEVEQDRTICSIEFVADAVIWVLNAFGAEITPVIAAKVPCHQFGSGYGLFWW